MPENLGKCPICCKHELTSRDPMHASVRRVECPLCGSYRLADSAFASTINKNEVLEHIHQLSGLLRNFNARSPTNETLEVDGRMMTSWDAVLKSAPIPIPDDLDIVAKADAVMHAIRGRCDGHLNYGLVCEQDTAYAIGFCHDAAEFHYLLEFAKEQDWFTHGCRRKYPDPTRRYELRLTPKGWARLTGVDDRVLDQGFIAMSFSKDLLPLRDNGLKPGIESAGYKALRIDRKEHNNRIDDEMIAEIRKSRFLVADLTNQNQGAYFEAGFAKGLGKEVVWTCEQTEVDEKKVHFDTRQYSIVTWSKDGYPDFAKRLAHRIEATLDRGHYHPPEHSSKTSATIP